MSVMTRVQIAGRFKALGFDPEFDALPYGLPCAPSVAKRADGKRKAGRADGSLLGGVSFEENRQRTDVPLPTQAAVGVTYLIGVARLSVRSRTPRM